MHDEKLVVGFIKRASQAGVPVDQIRTLVAQRFPAPVVKQAATQPVTTVDSVVTSLLKSAGIAKTHKTAGYTEGLLVEALEAGASFNEAVKVAEAALQETKAVQLQSKTAEASKQAPDFALYAEGFLKAALDAGYTDEQAKGMLTYRMKQANFMEMFKQAPGAQQELPGMNMAQQDMGGVDPSQLMGGMDPSQMMGGAGGAGDAQANPIIANLLAMLGGQGGGQPEMGGQPQMA